MPDKPAIGQVWLIPPHAPGCGGADNDIFHLFVIHSCDEGYCGPEGGEYVSTPGEQWWSVASHQISGNDEFLFGAPTFPLRENSEVLPGIAGPWVYLGNVMDMYRQHKDLCHA